MKVKIVFALKIRKEKFSEECDILLFFYTPGADTHDGFLECLDRNSAPDHN